MGADARFHSAATGALQGFAAELLTATAVETSRSRKLAVYRIDVAREDGTLVASLTGTVYLTGKPLPGAEAAHRYAE